MRSILAAVAAVVAVALAVGCGGSKPKPDVAACKSAMKHAYAQALSNPSAAPATRPPACAGVDDATLRKLAAQILSGN